MVVITYKEIIIKAIYINIYLASHDSTAAYKFIFILF